MPTWFLTVFISLAVLAGGLAGLYFLALYVAARFSVFPMRVPHWIAPGELALPQESVLIETEDGQRLRGWWCQGDPEVVVVFAHGYMMNRSEFVPQLAHLHPQPSALFFDFRAHGGSSGRMSTIGPAEANDVRAAVAYARQRCPGAKLIYMGSSMGAAAGLFALSEQPDSVDALILDSVYGSLDEAAKGWWDFIGRNKYAKLLTPSQFFAQRMTGIRPVDIRTDGPLSKLAGKPILFLHGDADPLVPRPTMERLVQISGPGAQVEWFAESSHGRARLEHPQQYLQAVTTFFEAVRNGPSPRDVKPSNSV